ncbi:hypothetical protein [Myroides sp. LoEW2-1]|uniref:hypothetical protein n=1 Tax=Myroides sp. LoEW2-1 TaxID=2683192 RepID=UPI00132BAE35|nr:hypothetical protein [Myroides sp. LoEW2-1]MVX35587.1 hypothetical protein [Myroides sp. LoEW2-1]
MAKRFIKGFVFFFIGVSCFGQKAIYKELNDAVVESMSSVDNLSDRISDVLNECTTMAVECDFTGQFSLVSLDESLSQTEIFDPQFLINSVAFIDGTTLDSNSKVITVNSLRDKYNVVRVEDLGRLPLRGIEKEVFHKQKKGYFVFGVMDRRLLSSVSLSFRFKLKDYKTYILVEDRTKVNTEVGDIRLVAIDDKTAVINYPYSANFEIEVEGVAEDGHIVSNVSINTMSIREEVMNETGHILEQRRIDNLVFSEPIAGVMIKTIVFNKKEEQLTFTKVLN